MRRSTWCGIVFALAVLITVLNFLPPIGIHYQVQSELVVSEVRLAQLRQRAKADRLQQKQGVQQPIQLLSVAVLDLAAGENSPSGAPRDKQVMLVKIVSRWDRRCDNQTHYDWLQSVTSKPESSIADDISSEQLRLAKWELEAALHYQSQHQFLTRRSPTEATASAAPRRTFELASYSTTPSGQPGQNVDAKEDALSIQLNEQVARAEQRVRQAEQACLNQAAADAGLLQIASVPMMAPRSTAIPWWMSASVIILGLSAGISAGWFQHRLQSGGIFTAQAVAQELAEDGIPTVGHVDLKSNDVPSTWTEAAANGARIAGRKTAARLLRLSEWVVMSWAVLIIARFFLDSVWRDMFISNPLAALGRILLGMP